MFGLKSRKTRAMEAYATAFLANPGAKHYGYGLWKVHRSGLLYFVLSQWLDEGYLVDGTDDPDEDRRMRHWYRLTPEGFAAFQGIPASHCGISVRHEMHRYRHPSYPGEFACSGERLAVV